MRPLGVLDGGLGRCGRVVYGMRSCAAGYLVSVVPSSSFSVFLAPAVRALCPSSCRHHPPLRFSHAALCRPPGSLAARTACGRVRRAPLVPVFFVCRRRLLRRLRARRRSPCAWLLVIPSSRAAPPVPRHPVLDLLARRSSDRRRPPIETDRPLHRHPQRHPQLPPPEPASPADPPPQLRALLHRSPPPAAARAPACSSPFSLLLGSSLFSCETMRHGATSTHKHRTAHSTLPNAVSRSRMLCASRAGSSRRLLLARHNILSLHPRCSVRPARPRAALAASPVFACSGHLPAPFHADSAPRHTRRAAPPPVIPV